MQKIELGQAKQLTALSNGVALTGLTYVSSNTDVATIDSNGLLTAVGEGIVRITITGGPRPINVTYKVVAEGGEPKLTLELEDAVLEDVFAISLVSRHKSIYHFSVTHTGEFQAPFNSTNYIKIRANDFSTETDWISFDTITDEMPADIFMFADADLSGKTILAELAYEADGPSSYAESDSITLGTYADALGVENLLLEATVSGGNLNLIVHGVLLEEVEYDYYLTNVRMSLNVSPFNALTVSTSSLAVLNDVNDTLGYAVVPSFTNAISAGHYTDIYGQVGIEIYKDGVKVAEKLFLADVDLTIS